MVGFCIRQLMNEDRLLNMFRSGEIVSLEEIQRRLFLCERSYNPDINDNLLLKAASFYLGGVACHSDFFTKGFKKYADELLVTEDDHLRVKKEMLGFWHETLTFCSPLLLLAAYSTDSQYVDDGIIYTSLVPPQEITSIIGEEKLYDLHLHLNGSTELDVLWQDALMFPDKIRDEYKKAQKLSLVIEQVEQLNSVCGEATLLHSILIEARSIRWYIVNVLLCSDSFIPSEGDVNPASSFAKEQKKGIHPLAEVQELLDSLGVKEGKSLMQYEYWMYILVLRRLKQEGNSFEGERLARWFHHYLLILGFMNRMVVQQCNQNGFRQFQKITVNELRTPSEKDYVARFRQMLSLDGDLSKTLIARIEGRYSPKANRTDAIDQLRLIDYGIMKDHDKRVDVSFALAAHFIKEAIDKFDRMRYDRLRSSLWKKACTLNSILKDKGIKESLHLYTHPIVAIDAAASEFDTPPEVFAPVFRFLRENHNDLQFTYHAGEDYYHPLSGLRAIYETITFFDYRKNDRIGHATALGIDPSLWFSRMPHSIFLSKEEWLDDLVFFLYFIKPTDSTKKRRLYNLIEELSDGKGVDVLTQAWLARRWDPDCLQGISIAEIDYYKQNELTSFMKNSYGEEIKAELMNHWRMSKYEEMNTPILVDTSIISSDDICLVQEKLMELICSKGIYLESLPTSNLRISIYKNYSEHHIKNWIRADSIPAEPFVVLGTDDPGIFATNLIYEYSHIAQIYDGNIGRNVIDKIIKDSKSLVNNQSKGGN